MKRSILILTLITLSLTGLSSCYSEDTAYPDTYYNRGQAHQGGAWHEHMAGGYHGGLNNSQKGGHPRRDNDKD